MRRFVVVGVGILLAAGCQGQGGNPFMRTTVPPPATGAGAPSDPYYNNSGGPHNSSQPPPIAAPQTVPVPGPAATAPVVPPPEKRYSAPGGYNFPQGSINHRKAIDPSPKDYRVGSSAIARAARPRNVASESPQESAIAGVEPSPESTPENTPLEEPSGTTVAKVMFAEDEKSAEEIDETISTADSAVAVVGESDVDPEAPTVASTETAIAAAFGEPAEASQATLTSHTTGGATVRIVSSKSDGPSAPAEPASTTLTATPSASPFKAVESSGASLTVAPPTAAATDAPAVATASIGGSATTPSKTRFYFDRRRSLTPSGAQPAAYVGGSPASVMFAGGGTATGVSSGPDGAASFSHHTSYSWLRGKLEYSTAGRRWKLRYIPIDGQTDTFGGSVVLPDSPQLEQFKPGQLVTVEGAIGNSPAEHGSFSPIYELRSIKPQQ